MAGVKKQTKGSKRSIAKSKEVQKPRRKPAKDAQVTDADGGTESSAGDDPTVDGAEELRRAVNQNVAANADAIATQMVAQAARGNSACTKLLLDVIDGKKHPGRPDSKRSLKWIGMLESEMEWSAKQTEDRNA